MNEVQINAALEKFKTLLIEQDARNQKIKSTKEFKDFQKLDKIVIVVGYRCKDLIDYIETLDVKTPIVYVENPIYDKTNNIYKIENFIINYLLKK